MSTTIISPRSKRISLTLHKSRECDDKSRDTLKEIKENEEIAKENLESSKESSRGEKENLDWRERALIAEKRVAELEQEMRSLKLKLKLNEDLKSPIPGQGATTISRQGARRQSKDAGSSSRSISPITRIKHKRTASTPGVALASPHTQSPRNSVLRHLEDQNNNKCQIRDVPNMDKDTFCDWLATCNLQEYIAIFRQEEYSNSVSETTKGFDEDHQNPNMLNLTKSSVPNILELLLLKKDSLFHVIFDYFKFLHDFFLTFRTFTSRLSLITFLRSKFISCDDKSTRDQITYVLQWWAEIGNGADFHSAKVFTEWRNLCECMETIGGYEEIAIGLSNYPPSIYERVKKESLPDKTKAPDLELPPIDFTSLDLSPLELARQLTLMMEARIIKIEPREFLKASWTKKKEKAPNIVKLQEYLSHVQGWIIAEILKFPKKEDRCTLITILIKTAKKFQEHNNFLGMITIVSTLQKALMKRLKSTWRLVDPKARKELEKMDFMLHPKSKFQRYYELLHAVPETDPCIPIVSITLDDIFKLNDVLHDEVDDPPGWINWKKMRTTSKLIWEVIQPRPRYNFKECLPIQRHILKGEAWHNEKVCSKIAQLRESQEYWDYSVTYENTSRLSTPSVMGLSDRDWKLLLAMGCELKTFDKGDKLVRQTYKDTYLFRIQKGEVKVTKTKEIEGNNNQLATLRTIKPGQVFGGFSIFSQFPDYLATSNVEVLSENLTSYQIQVNKFLQLCESRPDIECKLYYTLASALARCLRKPPPGKLQALRSSSRIINSDADSKISEVFKLPEEEAILHQYRCKLIDTVTKHGGTLYVTARHFLFVGTVFGFKKQVRLRISEVSSITAHKKTIKIDDFVFGFGPTSFKPAFEFIKNMWKETKKLYIPDEHLFCNQDQKSLPLEQNNWWSNLLEGSQSVTYKKGEIVVGRGQKMGGLYNITTGQCIMELDSNQEHPFTDTTMEEDTIFGEVEFLLGGTSPATIRAATDDTTVIKIESYFINILFQHQPQIAGRLYFQLGQVLYQRLLEAHMI